MSRKDYRDLDRVIVEGANAPSSPKAPTAYEELKAWCEKYNIPCEFWASEYSSDLCACFCDDLLVFDKNGKFLTIDQRQAPLKGSRG